MRASALAHTYYPHLQQSVLVRNSGRLFFTPARRCASSYPYLYHHHPPSTSGLSSHCRQLLFPWTYPSSISDMSQPPSYSFFQALFETALKDYENLTGINIVNHPIAKQLEACDSLDSITAILQEQAKGLREFRGDNGKLMKSVMCSIDVLYTSSTVLVRPNSHRHSLFLFLIVILQPFPPSKAIFAGIAILVTVCHSSFTANCLSP